MPTRISPSTHLFPEAERKAQLFFSSSLWERRLLPFLSLGIGVTTVIDESCKIASLGGIYAFRRIHGEEVKMLEIVFIVELHSLLASAYVDYLPDVFNDEVSLCDTSQRSQSVAFVFRIKSLYSRILALLKSSVCAFCITGTSARQTLYIHNPVLHAAWNYQ